MAATQAQAAPLAFLLLLSALLLGAGAIDAGGAHPEYGDQAACGLDGSGAADAAPARLRLQEERRGGGWGRILDITHAYVPDMPAFAPGAVTGPLVRLKASMANGSEYNLSELKMECHMGTHVDAPGHINQRNFAAGLDVDTLDLDVLNGCLGICGVSGLESM
ncbi:hypothetical protein PR202_ga06715 [Eleusine coracana subsp. coracana]|uniref:Uncharacterized protein n=1 Tax=Eleusine coracana subsp. coracana TaxID=191504 RepID=A0AAV5BVN7_ELECO|nr:hypothetical protein PR202_ga06715 [Eleusine coracana subsp. coracana]